MQDTLKSASLAFSCGKPEECVRILKPLLDRSSPTSPAQLLRARDLFARSMFALGNRKEALQAWEGALEELVTADAALSVPLLCNLAHGYMEAGRGKEAINMAARAVERARKAQTNRPLLAQALFTASGVYYRQKDLANAHACALESKQLWEETGNLEKAATCMNNLGRINEELGRHTEGMAWHEKAVAARRELPNKEDLAFSLGNLGVSQASAGLWAEAAASLTEALGIYEALNMAASPQYRGYSYNLDICKRALSGG